MPSESEEVLHKRVSASGLWSRRKAQELILEGRVEVNRQIITNKAARVPSSAKIRVDGISIASARTKYLLLNKPAGYVTTLSDPHAQHTVMELIADTGAKVKPVGRLDKDTEGLLILTNDGELAHRLTHPSYGIEKEYEAIIVGKLSETAIAKLEKGVFIEGAKTAPARIPREKVFPQLSGTKFHIVIHEGRKRQVRLMCEAVGFPVKKLRRVRIGPIVLKNLPKGTCRYLEASEIAALKKAVGL